MAASSHLSLVCPLVRIKVIETKNPSRKSPAAGINKQQNMQIAALNRKVAQLKLLANLPKMARRRSAKRSRTSANSTSRHPLHQQIVALVNPLAAGPMSGAQHLVDATPSVKYTVRGRTQVTVAASQDMFIGLAPSLALDSTTTGSTLSGFCMVGSGLGSLGSKLFLSATAGTDWKPTGTTGSVLVPNRPYYTDTNQLDNWRLVSYAIRIRYTGTALNANGTLKCLATPHGELNAISTQSNIGTLISELQSSPHTQLKTVRDQGVFDFNFIGDDSWLEGGALSGAAQGRGDSALSPVRIGQATSAYVMGEPGAYLFYANNSTSSVQFEVELVENWEVRSGSLHPFYTPSHSDPQLHHEIMNIVNTAHIRAGSSNQPKFLNVVSDVAKASKSPLGKAVLAAALA